MSASYITRRNMVFAATRIAGNDVTLVFGAKTAAGDGSYTLVLTEQQAKGNLAPLSEKEIQRLKEKGITITKGATLTLYFELTSVPINVKEGADNYKVIDYLFREGVSVLTLNQSIRTPAVVEAGA